MVYVLMIIGWSLLATSTFVWGGHTIYQLVKTDLSFWYLMLSNTLFWVIQLIVGYLLLIAGVVWESKK
jgi:hypothetical protein